VLSTGDPATGGYGVAAVVAGLPGMEAVVGVLLLVEPLEHSVGPKVAAAAAEISRALNS
jgi:hypothetical protein